jgi:hypothetical protein
LSAVEAIVSKYLAPIQGSSTKTTKRIIKRPYGVSVTDLDVLADNVIQKKNKVSKVIKKKKPNNDDCKQSKPKSKPISNDSSTFNMPNNPSQFSSHVPVSSHYSPSNHMYNYSSQTYSYQPPTSTFQPLHTTSTINPSVCGNCYQQFNNLNTGGFCLQCQKGLCWLCCGNAPYGMYYCAMCRSNNCQKQSVTS